MCAQRKERFVLSLRLVVALTLGLQTTGSVWATDKGVQKTTVVAERVAMQAKRTERVEGKADLVTDSVKVKQLPTGKSTIEQKGEASFYGDDFQGKATASGKAFDQQALTAAHPTLPLGTIAKVTNLNTGQSVNVKINDRGPYTKGRDIDLSKRAATAIGLNTEGAAPVKIQARIPDRE